MKHNLSFSLIFMQNSGFYLIRHIPSVIDEPSFKARQRGPVWVVLKNTINMMVSGLRSW
jgi:hypothetical protein